MNIEGIKELLKQIDEKVLPSGVILQKLFETIDRDAFETTFLESTKCYPLERKNLKICSKKHLFTNINGNFY